jgi:hypothetical protein
VTEHQTQGSIGPESEPGDLVPRMNEIDPDWSDESSAPTINNFQTLLSSRIIK